MDPHLYLIFGVAVIFGTAFVISTKGIYYHTPDTDNELMAYAAAQSHQWQWFSDLHKMGLGKTGMKDVTVILISVFQKIFHDKTGDHPYTALAGIVNAFSSFLIYLIALEYWGPAVALFLSLLYLFSLWNWQIALYGGHANVATMLFLLSVLFIQQTNNNSMGSAIWLILAGVIFCFAQFASASTIKYTPLFFAAVFFERYQAFTENENLYTFLWNNRLDEFNIIIIILYLSGIVVLRLFYKKIVKAMYFQKAPGFLNKMVSGRKLFPLDYYLRHAQKRIKQLTAWGLWTVLGFLFLINLAGYYYFILLVTGFVLGFLVLTLPDIKKSFSYYFNFLLETQIRKKSHFRIYTDYFSQKGLAVSRYTQGAGLAWLPKMFFRMIPVHVVIFTVSGSGLILAALSFSENTWLNSINSILIIVFSLSPIIWAEATKAPQLSRTYSPGLIGMLLSIGYGAYLFQTFTYSYFYLTMISALIVAGMWNLTVFFNDVYPARMSPVKLVKILKDMRINEIYTYKIGYNKCLIDTIPGLGKPGYVPRENIDPPFAVHYINSINEVRNGWVVIPGTNGKSLTMNGEPDALNDNFKYTKDPVLNKLLETHELEKIATAKLKTYGTSRIWPLESEVFGYMDLILHEIKPEDIYRGFAWLIHTNKLKNLNISTL